MMSRNRHRTIHALSAALLVAVAAPAARAADDTAVDDPLLAELAGEYEVEPVRATPAAQAQSSR